MDLNGTGEVEVDAMREAISQHTVSNGYRLAVTNDTRDIQNAELQAELRDMLLNDYDTLLTEFKEELGNDYNSAQSAYVDEPYSLHAEFKDPIFCFMYTEGYVEVEWNPDRTDFES